MRGNETLKYRVAEGARMKVPYMCVVGRREAEADQVAVNTRGAGEGQKPAPVAVDEFIGARAGRRRAGAGAPGDAQGRRPGHRQRDDDQQGVRLRTQSRDARRAGDQGGRRAGHRRRRDGVDVERAVLRLRHAQRREARRPDDGRRHDQGRSLVLVVRRAHGRPRRVHGEESRRSRGSSRTSSPPRRTGRRSRRSAPAASPRRSPR